MGQQLELHILQGSAHRGVNHWIPQTLGLTDKAPKGPRIIPSEYFTIFAISREIFRHSINTTATPATQCNCTAWILSTFHNTDNYFPAHIFPGILWNLAPTYSSGQSPGQRAEPRISCAGCCTDIL